ncbi:hypothetical protein P43SY_009200 [Pythium insidiosum]|uniref:RNA helicase n=1 Tax=Pythium insidiosum TaxID=114742 RepID=A0AAD5LS82_PYTIN|nr:hypothetical protein P43SY_009200 [Pythium insidiosum]
MAMATTQEATSKYVAESLELPLPLEQRCHEQLLEAARAAQRRRLRPHAPHDVRRGDRTRKRIARAVTVLRDDYEVPDELIREALRYSNTWEDALTFLALQRTSDALPASLRAAPQAAEERGETGDVAALDVVSANPRAAESERSAENAAEPTDDWEDAAPQPDEQLQESSAPTPTPAPAAADSEASDAAMSWTQRYLLQLAQEEELERQREKEEAALSPEARALRDLEAQFAALEDAMRQSQADGKLTKKKKKALSQDLQALRLRLVGMGWNEAQYRQSRRGAESEAPAASSQPAAQPKEPAQATPDEVEDDDESYGSALFATDASAPPAAAATCSSQPAASKASSSSSPPVLATFSPSSCASWTGKTPRELLADHCRRHKWQRPQFKKLSTSRQVHRYGVVVDGGKNGTRHEFAASEELFPVRDGFRSIDEAKDVVATVALYALSPQLPLYGMMPPPYRALWLSWEEAKRAAAEASASAVQSEFDAFVDAILNDVPEELATAADCADAKPEKTAEKGDAPVTVLATPAQPSDERGALSDWDVDDWDADLSDGEEGEGKGAGAEQSRAQEAEEQAEEDEEEEEEEESEETKARSQEIRRIFDRHAGSRRARELQATRQSLPIASFQSDVLAALEQHDVVLISGETGCGKSTQVPQFVLEDMVRSRGAGARCQIVCTQPRRLAAMSLAERVSAELGEPAMGQRDSLCGFQIRLEQRTTRHTRLLFCTTGVLLRRLQDPRTLAADVSHVIVDEVHERDVQSDVLLSMLRAFLAEQSRQPRRRRRLKVVLMSATLQAERFQQYFGGAARCPMLQVPGRTFPVQELFLEDVLERTAFELDDESPCRRAVDAAGEQACARVTVSGRGGSSYSQRVTWDRSPAGSARPTGGREREHEHEHEGSRYSARTRQTLARLDERVINYELIELLLEQLVTTDVPAWLSDASPSAAILVFLPGLQEISTLLDALAANRVLRAAGDALAMQLECLPLHSSLSPEDQRRVFDLAPARGFARKLRIIAATNVAETSLTIEDVKAVVDSGRAKEMRHDSAARTSVLEEVWVSRANAKQRLGRAGRTSGGVCFRLFSRETARAAMAAQPVPELLRAPLTSLCLQIKSLGVAGSCAAFLDGCLDAPRASSVADALQELHAIGALASSSSSSSSDGVDDDNNSGETLTPLGRQLARLPVDVRVGKLLLLGAIWGALDVVALCAAVLETKSPFVAPFGRQRDMQAARERFVVGASDVLTDVHALLAWRRVPARDEPAFCRAHFLSRRALVETHKLAQHLHALVAPQLRVAAGQRARDAVSLSPATVALCSALLVAALSPNVLTVDAGASSPSRLALRDGRRDVAFVHPSSVNAASRARAALSAATLAVSPCFSFAVKLHTSQVFVPASSLALPTALCLFAGAMDVVLPRQRALGDVTLVLDGWLSLRARSLRSAVLLQELRGVVQRVTQRELEAPDSGDGRDDALPPRETVVALVTELLLAELELRDRHRVLTKQLDRASSSLSR